MSKPPTHGRRQFLKGTAATAIAAVGVAGSASAASSSRTTITVNPPGSSFSDTATYSLVVDSEDIEQEQNDGQDDELFYANGRSGVESGVVKTENGGPYDSYSFSGELVEFAYEYDAARYAKFTALEASQPGSSSAYSTVEIAGDASGGYYSDDYRFDVNGSVTGGSDLEGDDSIDGNGQASGDFSDDVDRYTKTGRFTSVGLAGKSASLTLNQS